MAERDASATRLLRVAVEPATSEDARRCVAAYFDELERTFDGGFDPGDALTTLGVDFASPKGAFVVARIEDEAVGCGGLVAIDATTAEIKRVWTAPSARGLGVAKAVMSALEAEARARGFRRIVLDTNRALAGAQTMYSRLGFSPTGRYNDNPYAHHWFEKAI